MNGNFKVGEVLVGHGFALNPERNGQECVVISAAQKSLNHNPKRTPVFMIDIRYLVEWSSGEVRAVKPRNLRRKQPPTGEASILNMFVVAPPKRIREPA